MELYRDEPGMFGNLNDFNEVALGIDPRNTQAGLFKLFAVGVVEFVAVTVAFLNFSLSIGIMTKLSSESLQGQVLRRMLLPS